MNGPKRVEARVVQGGEEESKVSLTVRLSREAMQIILDWAASHGNISRTASVEMILREYALLKKKHTSA